MTKEMRELISYRLEQADELFACSPSDNTHQPRHERDSICLSIFS